MPPMLLGSGPDGEQESGERGAPHEPPGSFAMPGCVLGLMSIGLFFLPVPVLLLLAARWQSSVPSARVGS